MSDFNDLGKRLSAVISQVVPQRALPGIRIPKTKNSRETLLKHRRDGFTRTWNTDF